MRATHVAALVAALGWAADATGAPMVSDGPEDSWVYAAWFDAGIRRGNSYFPTSPSEYAGATFQSFVQDSRTFGVESSSPDGFHIFTTYIVSDSDQVLPLFLRGDDGHSLFIDDTFIGGGGFDVPANVDWTFEASVAYKFELAFYDVGGSQDVMFGPPTDDAPSRLGTWIEDVPGLHFHVLGEFPPPSTLVPEPSSFALLAAGSLALASGRRNWIARRLSNR